MALAAVADGHSLITDNVFPDRFHHVAELQRMGAQIDRIGPVAAVEGVRRLSGTHVEASDLRASAALVLAALVAKGETTLHNLHHLDRGYERLDQKLAQLGACIKRQPGRPRVPPGISAPRWDSRNLL